MRQLGIGTGLICIAIILPILFVLFAPTGTLARVANAIGNFIQRIVAWVKNLFT